MAAGDRCITVKSIGSRPSTKGSAAALAEILSRCDRSVSIESHRAGTSRESIRAGYGRIARQTYAAAAALDGSETSTAGTTYSCAVIGGVIADAARSTTTVNVY